MSILFVFLGGGIGASMRFLLSSLMNVFFERIWLSTLFVNIIGCLFFFLISAKYFGENFAENRAWQLFIKVGLLGSLTTFSTYSFEVVSLFKSNRSLEGCLVLFLNIFFGIIIGMRILK